MKKILVICDDPWHPAEVIEKGIANLTGNNWNFDFVKDAKDILTPKMLDEYQLIINCKSNNLTNGNHASWFEPGVNEVMPKDFESYVANGGGFLSVHSGNSFKLEDNSDYCNFVGNYFINHPPRCSVTVKPVKDHPITKGIESFTERDEHYEIKIIADDAEILLESESEPGGTQPAGYVRNIGDGRLCVLTPGHILAVWQNPMYKKLLVNAINWCCKDI